MLPPHSVSNGSGMFLLQSPWTEHFDALVAQAKSSLLLCSPFIGGEPCSRICSRANASNSGFRLSILTDLSRDNMLSGTTDVAALLRVIESFPSAEVRFLPSLHAKVYVADSQRAVVTSSNLTMNGLARNFEYGILLDDQGLVSQVEHDIREYASLASPVSSSELRAFAQIVRDLRSLRQEAERKWRGAVRREFDKRVAEADLVILRVRAAGRTPHAIFADAILHFVRRRPASTEELHQWVRAVHPDLCDDTVDRIIDGKHFGKKWKHAVRTAQQYLKRQGLLDLREGRWRLCGGQR